jgi:hypothetical protein
MALSSEFDALMAELDRLEKCAKNPDPLTKKAYKENPGERDRILKEIAAVRTEIKANTAVAFIGKLNATGSGLVKGVPWLGYVVGPGTAWSLETLKEVSQAAMNEIRKRVTCEGDLKIDASVGPAHLTAVKCGGPVGTWDLHLVADVAGSHVDETYPITLDENFTGPFGNTGTAVGPGGGVDILGAGTATYRAPGRDSTSGTLTLSGRGSVPVTVGKFCENGQPPGG